MPPAELEAEVLRAIRLELPARLPGLVLWRVAGGYDPAARQRYGLVRGCSDLIGIYRGRFIAIEVKRPRGGRVSDEQALFLQLVREHGGIALVARSVDEAAQGVATQSRETHSAQIPRDDTRRTDLDHPRQEQLERSSSGVRRTPVRTR